MKKHLIAAAVAGALAVPAMAQVTVYGLMDISYQSGEYKDGIGGGAAETDKGSTYGVSGALSGSRLGFKGTEDLGGGMKAGFVYELGLDASTGDVGSARLSFVELSGGFGTVRMGRQVTPQKAVTDSFYATGNSGFQAGLVGVNGLDTDGERVSKALTYITPSFSGFQAQVQAAGETNDNSTVVDKGSSQQLNFGATFSAGPFKVGVGMNTVDNDTEGGAQGETEYTAYGASYDLGMAAVYALFSEKEIKQVGVARAGKSDELAVGVRIPLGAVRLVVQYAEGEINDLGDTEVTKADGYQLHAIYDLSKRTNVYALYGDTTIKAVGQVGEDSIDGFAFGIRHSF